MCTCGYVLIKLTLSHRRERLIIGPLVGLREPLSLREVLIEIVQCRVVV